MPCDPGGSKIGQARRDDEQAVGPARTRRVQCEIELGDIADRVRRQRDAEKVDDEREQHGDELALPFEAGRARADLVGERLRCVALSRGVARIDRRRRERRPALGAKAHRDRVAVPASRTRRSEAEPAGSAELGLRRVDGGAGRARLGGGHGGLMLRPSRLVAIPERPTIAAGSRDIGPGRPRGR